MAETQGQWRATYAPGRWLLLSGPTSLVVLEPPPDHVSELIGDLWESVVASESLPDLAARLAAAGFDAMPSLAAFFWTADGMRSLVRGTVTVRDAATGDRIADGHGVQTWSEVGLGEVEMVRIEFADEQPASGLQFPLVVGTVQASSVVLDASEAAQLRSSQGTGSTEPSATTKVLALAPPDAAAADEPATERDVPAEDSGPATERIAMTEELDLTAKTRGPASSPTPPTPPTVAGPGAPPAPAAELGDTPTALMPAITEGGSATPSAVIMGLVCPQGHSNPPDAGTCRVCGDAIRPQPARPVPRPILGQLRVTDGTVVAVDRPVVIGRAPSEDAAPGSLPRLLTVASPNHDISRTHLQVAPDGWTLLATDLRSTNGTVVVWPGGGGRGMLRPDQPTPIPLGTRLELGDGIAVVVEQAG